MPWSSQNGCPATTHNPWKETEMATNQDLTKLLSGRKIDSVRQRDTDLDIDLTDGSTLSIKLAAGAQSVTLTNSDDKTEYSK